MPETPPEWQGIKFQELGFYEVESNSDEHGLYLVYRDRERDELTASVEAALYEAGFKKFGEALDGAVVGFVREDTRIALKVDQIIDEFYVAVFDRQGKEPLLHMLAFGEATVGEAITGEEAREKLNRAVGD